MVNSQISVDKTEAIADGIDLIFATVVLRDGANNPLPGKTVVLTTEDRGLYYDLAQITDVNGEAGIAFVGTASGTKTIKAFNVTDRGWVNGSSVIQFSPGEISSTKSRLFVPDDKTFAYVGYTLSVYLKAIDIWGNPITGQEIEFLSNRMDDVLGQPIGGDGEGVHTGKISSDYEGISIVTARTIVGGIDVGEAKEITFYRAGDTNFDQSVDLTDISILVYNYGKEGGDIVNTWTDINKDGVVDLTDISIMIYHYDG
ncbi:MAG: Bacterial Ig-like domain (group 1) [bacterium ADurb.Bin400]|nr:MAG: Bacterial Ig-like domain (group 1) [bacterium ADurb.Bin400]